MNGVTRHVHDEDKWYMLFATDIVLMMKLENALFIEIRNTKESATIKKLSMSKTEYLELIFSKKIFKKKIIEQLIFRVKKYNKHFKRNGI